MQTPYIEPFYYRYPGLTKAGLAIGTCFLAVFFGMGSTPHPGRFFIAWVALYFIASSALMGRLGLVWDYYKRPFNRQREDLIDAGGILVGVLTLPLQGIGLLLIIGFGIRLYRRVQLRELASQKARIDAEKSRVGTQVVSPVEHSSHIPVFQPASQSVLVAEERADISAVSDAA